MSKSRATGLGDPEPLGKKVLFQPPAELVKMPKEPIQEVPDNERKAKRGKAVRKSDQRIRTTIWLTSEAFAILQNIQNRHRLKTGKALPLWKAISQVIERYDKMKEGKGL